MARSASTPVMSATSTFNPSTRNSNPASTRSATNMGSISSDVERNTATSVPSVTTRPA